MTERSPGETVFPADIAAALEAVPFEARRVWRDPRFYWALVKTGFDFVAHNVPQWHRVLLRLNPYPKPWKHVQVPVRHDGTLLTGEAGSEGDVETHLSAWYAEGRPGASAVLFAPGTFQTKDDTARKARAIHLNREMGCHVLVVDLRGFGGSHAHLGSGGYVEAHDLDDAADWLRRETGVERVMLTGDSLGGASALIAAAMPGAEERFSAVMAWSPFADLESQLTYATTHPGSMRDPFWVPFKLYQLMVHLRSHGEARDFNDFLALRANELGVDPQELLRLSSPVTHLPKVRVPAIVHHAEDDPIVPVAQARLLAEAAAENPLVHVRVLPEGGHAQFEHWCPEWYWGTIRAVLDNVYGPAESFTREDRARPGWRADAA